jgi:hypothetical protein
VGDEATAIQVLMRASDSLADGDKCKAKLAAAEIMLRRKETAPCLEAAGEIAAREDLDPELRGQAYALCAEAYAPTSPLRAMAAYESSLRLNPSESAVRFSLAFMYSESGLNVLARHHYRILVDTNQANPTAINNLGVANRELGLRGQGFANYLTAGEKGSALALANTAHLYLDIGDLDSAKRAIERGSEVDAQEDRLISARERLALLLSEERKRGDELAGVRTALRDEFLAIDHRLSSVAPRAGTRWKSETGEVYSVTRSGEVAVLANEDVGTTIVLSPQGSDLKAKIQKGKYGTATAAHCYATEEVVVLIHEGNSPGGEPPIERLRRAEHDADREQAPAGTD